MLLGLLCLILMLPTLSFAQEVTENVSEVPAKKRFSINYQFTKRSLGETSFAKNTRSEKFANQETYYSPSLIEFDQHIVGLRYQLNEKLALDAGTSYMKSNVVLKGHHPVGYTPGVGLIFEKTEFSSGSSGLSDSRVAAHYELYNEGEHRVMATGGLNIPTGSVKETDRGRMLPYSGQLGSGTYDLLPEIAYTYGRTGFVSGTRLAYTLRTGRSDLDYRMGNQTLFDTFVGYDYRRAVGAFLRGRIRDWGSTSDPRYESPTASKDDPYIESGTRWELLATARVGLPIPTVGAVIVEGGVPLYQDQRSGEVQLETDWYLTSRLVASF